MNTRTQSTIGKIFVQYTIALAVFASLGSFAKADTASEEQNIMIMDELFDSAGAADFRQYLVSQTEQFSARELTMAAQVDLTGYSLKDAGQHSYDDNFRFDANDKTQTWPLLSLNVQDGDVNIKMGSKYNR